MKTAHIHRNQFKNHRVGIPFWFIEEDNSLKEVILKHDMEAYTMPPPQGKGVVVKCPDGRYVATIYGFFPITPDRIFMKWGNSKEEAAQAVIDAHQAQVEENEEFKDPRKELAYQEAQLDRSYEYSDDHRVWQNGERIRMRIATLKEVIKK